MTDLQEVIQNNRKWIMQIKGVTGVGAGLTETDPKEKCIIVYSTKEDWPNELPNIVEGYKVVLKTKKGGFKALIL